MSQASNAAAVLPVSCKSVHNIRDLAEACPAVKPGRVLRCAKPSEATEEDVDLLLGKIGIKEMLDLRSSEELAEDAPHALLFSQAKLVAHSRGWLSSTVRPLSEEHRPNSKGQLVHHQVSLLDRGRYYTALLRHVSAGSLGRAAVYRLWSKEWSRQVLLKEVNAGGLLLLYKILVDSAQPEIAFALRIVSQALASDKPVLLFCKAGKDRTGIMAMLLLTCAGATREQVLDDYVRSDAFHMVALAGIENKPELAGLDRAAFERAPRDAMEGLLHYLDVMYGRPESYLTYIGFGPEEQAQLKKLMTGGASA